MASDRIGGVVVSATVEARHFGADMTFPAGQVTALVGPNGSGKSTTLALVSGEIRPDAGEVTIDGRVVADATTSVPPHRRTTALLQQRALLFPHLSVLDNVAFGVRARGAGRRAARDRAASELAAMGAAEFADRRPHALSGGEQQRVSLARALATDPTVVLLDEPLASVDVATAASLRQVLASRLSTSDATVVLVTHDPLDVWALADRVVCLDQGRVTASGEVADVLGRPRTGFLADLSGVNLLRGIADVDGLSAGRDPVVGLWDRSRPAEPGHAALAAFEPSAVALFATAPQGSPRNTWPVTVVGIDPRGPTVRVHLRLADNQTFAADLTAQGTAALAVRSGARLIAQVKATQVTLYGR